MPQVPRVTGPGVDLRAAPNVQQNVSGVNSAAFGGRTAALVGDLGNTFQHIKDTNDADQVFRAETALKTDYLAFERSEMERQGVDAKGAGERAAKWWGEASTKYAEGLTSGRQSQIFNRSLTAVQMAGNETLLRHETQQRNRSVAESTMAQAGTAANIAIADPSQERVDLSRQQIISSYSVLGKLRGEAPEVTQAATQKALTDMHKGVVMRLVDDDPDAAKAYFYTHRKEIDGSQQQVIEKALKHGGLLLKGQQVADKVMNDYTDLNQANAYIEANFSGEEEKAVKQEVQQRWAMKDTVMNKARTEAYGQGQLLVARGQRVPQSLALTMGDGHYAQLLEHAEARAKRLAAEDKIKTDFKTYDTLNRLSWQDPQSFANLDLGRFQDRLSSADLKRFSEDQQKMGTAEGQKGLQSREQQIATAMDQLKLRGDSNAEKRGLFSRKVNDALMEEQKVLGRPLKYEETQKVIDQQTISVAIPGFIWDTEKRAYEVKGSERDKAKIVVPEDDRKQIIEALRAKGQPTNEVNILDLYKRVKGIR